MLLKTKGVVLRFVKYKETSIIATIYTEQEGLISVIVNSVRSKSSKSSIALFQPLSLIDLVIYFNHSRNINRVSEVRSYHPLHQIRQDPIKSTISIFLTEILNKCLKEEVGNYSLYHFIQDSIITLNNQKNSTLNFHIIFLFKLSQYLGFKPTSTKDYTMQISNKNFYSDDNNMNALKYLLHANYDTPMEDIGNTRQIILNDLLEFYRNHLDFGRIKSVEVLHELFHS